MGKRESHGSDGLGFRDQAFTVSVVSVVPECLRHHKQLLLVPSQGILTDKMQVSKASSESSALIKELLSVVIVVGCKKEDNWCLRKGAGMGVPPRKV